jgi:hypothetical protein
MRFDKHYTMTNGVLTNETLVYANLQWNIFHQISIQVIDGFFHFGSHVCDYF